ncbi:MAG: TolC family protein [Phycisphaerales bacterium]|nr:TolC family protein [Phycisphaerales bacterium]
MIKRDFVRLARLCAIGLFLTSVPLAAIGQENMGEMTPLDTAIEAYSQRMINRGKAMHEQEPEQPSGDSLPAKRDRNLIYASDDTMPPKAALLADPGDPNASIVATWARIDAETPDPRDLIAHLQQRLDNARSDRPNDQRLHKYYERVLERAKEYVGLMLLPEPQRVTLAECVQSALANNFAIRIQSINPAVSETQIVEAEAAFDAVFFLDTTYDNRDQAVATQLSAGQSDVRSLEGGIRQLLPTGMRVQTSMRTSRSFVPFQFQQLNPAYNTSFIAQFTQPLLRGFGLDVNRAQIEISRRDYEIEQWAFEQRVRDTLLDVERGFWRLLQARRDAAVLAEAVAENWATYRSIKDRRTNDASLVEIEAAKARWESRKVDLAESIRALRSAEDQLKRLIQNPSYPLSRKVELIPVGEPVVAPLVVDQFAEARRALDERSEIKQARARVEQARTRRAVSKNNLLPQLDLSFNYEVQGLGASSDRSLDVMTTNRFRSYSVTVNFSIPIGNRGAQAADRRAALQQQQAVVALHDAYDQVILEVNEAVRLLIVRSRQIGPQLQSAYSNRDSLQALQAKTTKIDPGFLEAELNSIERLANDRRQLIGVTIDHTIAIAELERAKGTLLEFNNIVLTDKPHPTY